jgi:threonine dehydrogenase-like Zn-dependent dehydrogenase
MVMNALVQSVKPTAGIGVVGVYVPEDPESPDAFGKKGQIAFDLGKFFEKGLRMGSGQCNVKKYNRYLCQLIHEDRAKPSWIVSHEVALEEAPDAYKHFDHREEGWTKVILRPGRENTKRKRKRELAHA